MLAYRGHIHPSSTSIYFYSWQRGREGGISAILYYRGTLGCPSDKPTSCTTSLNICNYIYYFSDFQSDLRNKPT
ncbi:hypothetical protein VN97_g9617 [Penicillium thymicola]|uniref:Uncharacterized protein n=1 Tax=Penicillium thymicola TaxID=293382 RepID=A0AAI9TAM3_PENTH|nr:hypothetical protein VN97_g9617 [Penicillium thymicola]